MARANETSDQIAYNTKSYFLKIDRADCIQRPISCCEYFGDILTYIAISAP